MSDEDVRARGDVPLPTPLGIGASYADACKRAATDQGLDPFTDAMKAQTGQVPEVWQTGGFTMVAVVRRDEGGFYSVTHEDGYVVVYHPDEASWDQPEDERYTVLLDGTEDADADRAVQAIIDHDGAI